MGAFGFGTTPFAPIVYVANGTEGDTLTVPAIFGRTIDLVTYNTLVLIPETAPPDQQGYSYDAATATFTFGFPLNANDVIQILTS